MNLRLTFAAALAVLLASLSLSAVISGIGWFGVAFGAVIVVAAAGILTRLSIVPFAVTTTFLALICAMPLLTGPNWATRVAGLVIAAFPLTSLTGARLFRGLTVVAAYLASLLIYVNLAYARSPSFAWLIPTNSSMQLLGQLTRQAFTEFQYAPPIPDLAPLNLVIAAGVGLVAILVDLLAARLRRPAIAGLPLLLLFSVPVATNLKSFTGGQSITFALGIAGFLMLLSADGRERLRLWGRLVTFRHVQSSDEAGAGPDTRELAASGRRIGLAAVCLAVVIPLILPSLHVRDIFTTGNGGHGQGSATVALRPLLDVEKSLARQSPRPVLTYTTDSPKPSLQYLQVYVLNYSTRYNNWLPSFPASQSRTLTGPNLPGGIDGVDSHTPVTSARTTIVTDADQSGQAILPMPYAPVSLDIMGGPWTEITSTKMIFASRQLGRLTYTVTSKEASPTQSQITSTALPPPGVQALYGSYNGPDANKLLTIALKHTAGATTPLQRALALQAWFLSGDFTYTFKTRLPHNRHWLDAFLTRDKRGFCQQFAWAFAVLARLLDIPSRIAVGYTGGQPDGHGGYAVTTADAHAWPELYFPGDGWLRFEPTPSGADGQGTATVPDYAFGGTPGASNQTVPNATGQGQNAAKTTPNQSAGGGANRLTHLGASGPAGRSAAQNSGLGYAIGIPVAVFLLIAWPSVTRLVTRRRRWLTASGDAGLARAAWLEVTDDLVDYGFEYWPGETPRALTRRIAREASLDDSAIAAIRRIAAAIERARYALAPQPGAGLAADVQTVRRSMADSRRRGQRLRARLLPASTLAAAWQLVQRAGDLFNWLDLSWPGLRRQFRRSMPERRPG